MAVSPRMAEGDLVTASVLVNGSMIKDVYRLIAIDVTHAVNRIPTATITFADGDATEEAFEVSEESDFAPGAEIEIRAGYDAKNKSIFKGLITRQSIRIGPGRGGRLSLVCHDKALAMTVARRNLEFNRVKDSEAISALFREAGLSADVTATDVTHEHLVMNDASPWDYALCRAEANGFVVTLDGGKARVGPPPFAAATLKVQFGESIAELDLELDAATQIASVEGRSWDPKSQAVTTGASSEPPVNKQGDLSGKALSGVLRAGPVETPTQTAMDTAGLKTWANASLLRSRLSRVRGRVSFPGYAELAAGALIDLGGLGKRFNGSGYVSAVHHRIAQGAWTTEAQIGIPAEGFTDRNRDVSAPPAAGLKAGAGGLQIAKVKQVYEDAAGERRVLVSLPLTETPGEGVWVRIASPYASNGIGIEFLPEVDDEVLLGFLNDDPDAPVILGSLHSSARPSPVTPDKENKIKSIVTRSRLELSFDDVDKVIEVRTPGGHVVTMSDKDKSVTIADSNGNKVELSESGIGVSSPKDVRISADGAVSITGETGVTMSSSADVEIKGANATMQGEMSATVKGGMSAELGAGTETTIRGGMVMIN